MGSFSAPAVADLDGDGDLDILVGEQFGSTFYFENTGDASAPAFADVRENPFGLTPVVNGFSAPTFGDLDGDGDIDVLIGRIDGSTSYFENTGTATAPAFAAPIDNAFGLVAVGGPEIFSGTYSVPILADLDGDGDLDALIGRADGASFSRTRVRPRRQRSLRRCSMLLASPICPTSPPLRLAILTVTAILMR